MNERNHAGEVAGTSWSPGQYQKFGDHRLRPALELLDRVPLESPGQIYDLGCGTGQVTRLLAARWSAARVVGVDNSTEMLEKARAGDARNGSQKSGEQSHQVVDPAPDFSDKTGRLSPAPGGPAPTSQAPGGPVPTSPVPDGPVPLRAPSPPHPVRWEEADIASWDPERPPDLIYSNAALHWVPDHASLFPRLMRFLEPGGCLAVQMPLSWGMPSHRLMRETLADGGPGGAALGTAALRAALGRKWVEDTEVYYDLLAVEARPLDIWETEYLQVLNGPDPVFEWVKGTGLRPILNGLDEAELAGFLGEYRRRLRQAYPIRSDGRTLYPFRRLFMVAVK